MPGLDDARANFQFAIERGLDALDAGGEREAEAYFTVSFAYRLRAICRLLQEADCDGFLADLARAGHARLAMLERAAEGRDYPSKSMATSRDLGFAAAVAAGDVDTAREIAALSARTHDPDVEYEDDFMFFHVLHRLVVADPSESTELSAALHRWEEILEGETSGYLDACHSLVIRDPDSFDAAMTSFLEHRAGELERYGRKQSFDPDLAATEGKISVEAIALLRIAEDLGFPTQTEYTLVPSLARVPQSAPLPARDSWKSPS